VAITVSISEKYLSQRRGTALLGIRNKERLHAAESSVRESIIEHATLPRMRFDVRDIPSVRHVDVVRPGSVVRLRFDYVSFCSEYRLESSWGVHDDRIWAVSEHRP
jgi:hypothetical protein